MNKLKEMTMMLRQGEVLTLDDNKTYSVVYTTVLDDQNYAYLIEQDDYTNTMFCKYSNDKLEEVTEPEIIEKLMFKFKERLN